MGRAMLLAGLHRLKAAGVATAIIGVDAENSSGALHLYELLAFTIFATAFLMLRMFDHIFW